MTNGTVKWFNSAKGFGFIAPDDGSKDAFVHISTVERAGMSALNEDQRVSFDLISRGNGKMAAENLRAAEKPEMGRLTTAPFLRGLAPDRPRSFMLIAKFKVPMISEQTFLVIYGIQHFVAYSQVGGKRAFSIKRTESRKMINHAKHLIRETFGETATILVT